MTNKTTPDDDWLRDTVDKIYSGYSFGISRNHKDLVTGAVAAINAKITELLVEERMKAYQHLNRTYWEDKTDSIPCADIDREIAQLQTSQPINEQKGKI